MLGKTGLSLAPRTVGRGAGQCPPHRAHPHRAHTAPRTGSASRTGGGPCGEELASSWGHSGWQRKCSPVTLRHCPPGRCRFSYKQGEAAGPRAAKQGPQLGVGGAWGALNSSLLSQTRGPLSALAPRCWAALWVGGTVLMTSGQGQGRGWLRGARRSQRLLPSSSTPRRLLPAQAPTSCHTVRVPTLSHHELSPGRAQRGPRAAQRPQTLSCSPVARPHAWAPPPTPRQPPRDSRTRRGRRARGIRSASPPKFHSKIFITIKGEPEQSGPQCRPVRGTVGTGRTGVLCPSLWLVAGVPLGLVPHTELAGGFPVAGLGPRRPHESQSPQSEGHT